MDCIFCKIAKKEIQSDIVYDSERICAFRDVHPRAPAHILIVPKLHIESVNELGGNGKEIAGEMVVAAQKIAEDLKISDGYKLLFNVGKKGGQIVEHLHLHLMGGW